MLISLIITQVIMLTQIIADPSSNQLPNFKKRTSGPIGIVTTSNGAPVEIRDTTLLNSPLLNSEHFIESMAHLVRERIPDRIIHPKGAGAFGYFQVTHNISAFCKAKMFSEIGKQTPVVARFSLATREKGEPDTSRDARGFAVKFFTEEGNFDFVGFNTPMYFYKDPMIFPSMTRATRRNPETNLKDPKMFWDLVTLRPETMFFFLFLFSYHGIPDGYRYMPGYSVHTYQIYNKLGETFFARLHILPDAGEKYIKLDDAAMISLTNPDYAGRDLYNAIAMGNFPSWTVSAQILSPDDVKNCTFDPFDMTRILPLDIYPLTPIGKLVLNINPVNYFTDVEQLALAPSHVVPGILGAPDKVFESRRLMYRDSQLQRLGANFNNVLVNCPLRSVFTYDRDGRAPVGYNGGGAPSYYPNSYNGPEAYYDKKRPKLVKVKHDKSFSFDQAADFYSNDLTKEERDRFIYNLVESLSQADKFVQKRAIDIFNKIHPDMGQRVIKALDALKEPSVCSIINGW